MLRKILKALGIANAPTSGASGKDILTTAGPFTKFTIVGEDGVPYLTRYYLIKNRFFSLYLHRIHRSDEDRALHCHPRQFVSFLLNGPGYTEHQSSGRKKFFSPFSINTRHDPADPHRLEVEPGKGDQWTLVLMGPYKKRWGFHVPDEFFQDGMWPGTPSKYVPGARWVDHESFLTIKFGPGKSKNKTVES